MTIFCDTETFSSTPIRNGVHAYSDADDFEIMVITFAEDDAPVVTLDLTAGDDPAVFVEALARHEVSVWHNSPFDRTVLRKAGIVTIDPSTIHDTLVNALAHGLPGSLDKLCGIFKVSMDLAKDKRGKELIQMFCKPQPKNTKLRRKTRHTHPVEWQQFLDYAGSDILAMRDLYKRMPRWNFFDCPKEHALWVLDQEINDRGLPIDVELCEQAERAVLDEKARLKHQVVDLTDGEVESATKRDQLLGYVLAEYGITLPDLRGGTLERRLEDEFLPEPLKELLRIRLQAASASSAKYKRMTQVISPDGRMRGGLQFNGASATQRWSGRLFQVQNLPRPTWMNEEIETFIEALKAGCEDLVTDNVMKGLANAVRGLIYAPKGRKLVVTDLANIEGRVMAWLANEEWKLEAFRAYDAGTGPDLYLVGYSKSFGLPLDQVTKDMRQLGKVCELALQYQGAVGAFGTMAKLYGIELPEKEILRVVGAWRDANENIRNFWRDLESAWAEATSNPGVRVRVGKVVFQKRGSWLRILLPDGQGYLSYASAGMENGKPYYWGQNNYTRKWERIWTYGGKISNAITQRTARDIMAYNLRAIQDYGYDIDALVHDEVITDAPDDPRYSAEHLTNMLAAKPDWPDIDDLPLAAAGFEGKRYRKD